jgi:hypothetical protein
MATSSTSYNLDEWLAYVARQIRVDGFWTSGKEAYQNKTTSTSKATREHLFNLKQGVVATKVADSMPSPEDWDLAKRAITWAREQLPLQIASLDKPNEFLSKLAEATMTDTLTEKEFGLTAALITTYTRSEERRIKEEQAEHRRLTQEFYGEKGKRYNLKLTVIDFKEFVGQFGYTTVYTLRDRQDRIFKWFATGPRKLDKEQTYEVRGTVKSHEVDKFSKDNTTILSRCTVGRQLA